MKFRLVVNENGRKVFDSVLFHTNELEVSRLFEEIKLGSNDLVASLFSLPPSDPTEEAETSLVINSYHQRSEAIKEKQMVETLERILAPLIRRLEHLERGHEHEADANHQMRIDNLERRLTEFRGLETRIQELEVKWRESGPEEMVTGRTLWPCIRALEDKGREFEKALEGHEHDLPGTILEELVSRVRKVEALDNKVAGVERVLADWKREFDSLLASLLLRVTDLEKQLNLADKVNELAAFALRLNDVVKGLPK